MGYCINCGLRIENEEMICVNCGTNMSKYIKKNTRERNIVSNGVLGELMQHVGETAKNILISPVISTIRYSKELSLKLTITLLAILSIIFGGVSIIVYEAIFSWIISFNKKLMENPQGMSNNIGDVMTNTIEMIKRIKMEPMKVFLIGFIIFIIIIISELLITFVIGKFIFKSSFRTTHLVNVIICSFIPMMAAVILLLVFGYISIGIGLIPLVIGGAISTICLFQGIKEVLQINENRAALIVPCAYIISVFVMYNYALKLFSNYFTVANIRRLLMFLFNGVFYF